MDERTFSNFEYKIEAKAEQEGSGGYTVYTRQSIITWKESSIAIAMPIDEFMYCFSLWTHDKCLIQDCFPDLDDDEREFIMSGITVEEWTDLYGPDDDTELSNTEVA